MKSRDLDWFPLDPDKADCGAKFGAYVNGVTLLELPSGIVAVVGHMSCAARDSAEYHARNSSRHDADQFVSRARLLSWKAN